MREKGAYTFADMKDAEYEILVIDDEEWVCRGLVSKLSKSGLPLRSIKDFPDAQSVFRYIDEGGCPDIMICDIRMPGLDGLSLCSAVKKRMPDVRVIISTGYGEFEYAKRAIQVGVSEYLLKPIDGLELYSAVKKCTEALDISRRNGDRLAKLQEIEREKQARNRFGGGVEPGDLSELFPAYGKPSEDFVCVYFRVPDVKEADFHDTVNRMGPEFLGSEAMANSVLYSYVPEEYVLLFLQIDPAERIKRFAEALVLQIRKDGVQDAAAGLSDIRGTADAAVMDAVELMKHRILFDELAVVTSADVCGREERYFIPSHHLSTLKFALGEGNEKTIAATMAMIESEAGSLNLSYRSVENAYLQLLMLANEERPPAAGEKTAFFLRDAYKFGTLKALFSFVKEAYLGCIEISKHSAAEGKAAIVRAVAGCIDENFDEYITLERFATSYGINACYLSLLFKEVMGVNFQDYLSNVRIRNAKEYLASGRFKISEVAEKTGFTNRFYFSKAFKKIEGLTPTEFMSAALK